MKGLIKFIPVALAAVALASCSNDDFLSSEGEYTPSENAIALYLDNGTTRTGIQETAEGNHFVWTKGDIIKLYGVNQVKTNKYKVKEAYKAATAEYNKSGLLGYAELQGDDNIGSDLAFAMYPGTDENFFNSEYFNQFEMQLPAEWTYDVMGDNDDVFYADFPMWGVANADNSAVTFKYTTAFLRLDLSGLSASANAAIYITADKQLNGRFTGTISDIDGATRLTCLLWSLLTRLLRRVSLRLSMVQLWMVSIMQLLVCTTMLLVLLPLRLPVSPCSRLRLTSRTCRTTTSVSSICLSPFRTMAS